MSCVWQTKNTSQLATPFLVIIPSLFSGMLKGTHTKGMVFARRGSRVKKKCGIFHSSFHQDVVFGRSFILNSSRTNSVMDIRVLQRSQSCCMRVCQNHLKSEQESKYLTTLMVLFRYFLYLTAHPFYLGVCVTHLLRRRLYSLKQNRLVWVIKTCFSQNPNPETFLIVLWIPKETSHPRHSAGHMVAAPFACGWSTRCSKRCSVIVQPRISAELSTVFLQDWMASPNRPEVVNSEQMLFLWIFSYLWCLSLFLFVCLFEAVEF